MNYYYTRIGLIRKYINFILLIFQCNCLIPWLMNDECVDSLGTGNLHWTRHSTLHKFHPFRPTKLSYRSPSFPSLLVMNAIKIMMVTWKCILFPSMRSFHDSFVGGFGGDGGGLCADRHNFYMMFVSVAIEWIWGQREEQKGMLLSLQLLLLQ